MGASRYEILRAVILGDYKAFRKGLNINDPYVTRYEAFEELDGIRKAHCEIVGVHSPFLTTDEIGRLYGFNETSYTRQANYIRRYL